jgi:prophage regulatory protein
MLRLRALAEKSGYSGTTIYRRIAVGLWTTPVRLGPQRSVWPEHEADALLGARVAGGNDDEIRQLVVRPVGRKAKQPPHVDVPTLVSACKLQLIARIVHRSRFRNRDPRPLAVERTPIARVSISAAQRDFPINRR